jgi:hypothetical protein
MQHKRIKTGDKYKKKKIISGVFWKKLKIWIEIAVRGGITEVKKITEKRRCG